MENDNKKVAKQIRMFAEGESPRDAESLQELAKLVKAGEMKKAWGFYREIDSFVREAINEDIKSFLFTNRTKGKKIVPVRIKFEDEILHETELIFPSDISEEELALAVFRWEGDRRENILSFEYGDIKTKRK